MAQEPLPPPKHSGLAEYPQPKATSTEDALVGPEFMPVYANFIRDFTDLPPAPPGGNWVFTP